MFEALFSERGLEDTADVWKCLNANDGKELWTYSYPAAGNLDYGNCDGVAACTFVEASLRPLLRYSPGS